jgi:hypothetical protein
MLVAAVLALGVPPAPAAFGDMAAAGRTVTISADAVYTTAVKTDGSLWAWGLGSFGKLGDGTTEARHAPVKVMDGVASVSASLQHTMAVKTDGSLWAWGLNNNGQLGDGTETSWDSSQLSPVKVMDGAVTVSSRDNHTMAVKTDGSLWAWGANYNGELGDGTRTERASPVKIMDGVLLPTGAGAVTPPAPAAPVAVPTPQNITLDGAVVSPQAYNIDGSNYFKLRDVAALLNGTGKQFGVDWDAGAKSISLIRGNDYAPDGSELQGAAQGNKTAALSAASVRIDGKAVSLTAYNIGGSTYFKLRDLGKALDFGVTYDAASKTAGIDTRTGYTE